MMSRIIWPAFIPGAVEEVAGGRAVAFAARAEGARTVTPVPLITFSRYAVVIFHCGVGKPSSPIILAVVLD